MAIRDVRARRAGQWSGCHSVAWDANSPENSGTEESQTSSRNLGIHLVSRATLKGKDSSTRAVTYGITLMPNLVGRFFHSLKVWHFRCLIQGQSMAEK